MTRIFAIACAALFLTALPAPAFASLPDDDPVAPFALGPVAVDLPPIVQDDGLPPVDPPLLPPDPPPEVPADPPPGVPTTPVPPVGPSDPLGPGDPVGLGGSTSPAPTQAGGGAAVETTSVANGASSRVSPPRATGAYFVVRGRYSGRGATGSAGAKRIESSPAPAPLLTPSPGQDLTFTPVPSGREAPRLTNAASTLTYPEDPASAAATWFVIVFAVLGIGVVAGSSIVRRVRYR
ncbi:MAG: hypothetical protein HY996_06890 [Micrococcales bacterium]|nr:hypothetical protein [Micrococcales bacterium]